MAVNVLTVPSSSQAKEKAVFPPSAMPPNKHVFFIRTDSVVILRLSTRNNTLSKQQTAYKSKQLEDKGNGPASCYATSSYHVQDNGDVRACSWASYY